MTAARILQNAGGFDGLMIEAQLSSPVTVPCDKLRDVLRKSVNDGHLNQREYDRCVLLMVKIHAGVEELAERLNPLRSGSEDDEVWPKTPRQNAPERAR